MGLQIKMQNGLRAVVQLLSSLGQVPIQFFLSFPQVYCQFSTVLYYKSQ